MSGVDSPVLLHREGPSPHLAEAAANAAEATHQRVIHPSHQGTTEAMQREEAGEHKHYKYITLSNKGAEQLAHVPFGRVAGYAPSGVPAYSNGSDTHFSNAQALWAHPSNAKGKGGDGGERDKGAPTFYTGFEWQCVEFARRWLLQQRGILLPDIQIAAHIIYLHKMLHVPTMEEITVRPVFNGSFARPRAGSLIIYPQSNDNFVGHVGVIVEAGEDYVRVADQNRFFHDWGDASYSAEFRVERDAIGQYWIRDDVTEPVGWVTFPFASEAGELLVTVPPVPSPEAHSTIDGLLYAGVNPSLPRDASETSAGASDGGGASAAWLEGLSIPSEVKGGTMLGGWTYLGFWCRSMGSFQGKLLFGTTLVRILAYVSYMAVKDKVMGKPPKSESAN